MRKLVFCVPVPRRLRFALSLALLACGCEPGLAQSAAPAQQIIHQTWTFRDGAPEGVNALAQTSDGYLWLGAPSGLIRFDGVRFEPFRSPFGDRLLSTYVFSLFAPRTGGLWVGYAFGGFSFIHNGRVTNYPIGNTGTIYSFAEDKSGVVWAGAGGGLWRFDGSSWQRFTDELISQLAFVCAARVDHDGILWVLIDSLRSDSGKEMLYLPPNGTKFHAAGSNLFVEGFTLDADDFVLTTRDPAEAASSGVKLESPLPAYPILRKGAEQRVDRNHAIWSVPRTGMTLRHDLTGSVSETLHSLSDHDTQSYSVDPYRYAHIVDREGSIWFGNSSGIQRLSYSPLVRPEFPKAETTPFYVVAPDEGGAVWVSAGAGNGLSHLYRVANGRVELLKTQGGLSNIAYPAHDKTLWLAGEGGLWHMVNGHLRTINLLPEMLSHAKSFQAIAEDRSGGLWVSMQGQGLYRYSDGVWTPYGGRKDIQKAVVSEFTDTLGRVWFGYMKNKLSVLDGDSVKQFGPSDGIRIGNITAIYGRGREIWIGGEFGLQQCDAGKFRSIEAIDKEALRGISGIVETANGDLWLNGLGGIVHITRAELQEALRDPAHAVSGERFGRREGVPGLPQQLSPLVSAVEGTDGRLWFPVTNGVVWLDPAQAANRLPPAPVMIQSLTADDKGYGPDGALTFPAHTANVQIHYAATSLLDPEAIRFRYRLRETDNDWQEAGTSTAVSYRNLRPGTYHFVVNASDVNGRWSENMATAEFTMLPAYYQTNWFRAAGALALVGFLWAAYRWRVRLLQHRFEMTLDARVAERTRIARELHDTLLQSFHGLLLRLQMASQVLRERPAQAQETLDRAIEQAAAAVTEGRDAVQALRESTVQSNDLALAISTLGEELAILSTEHRAAFRVAVEGESQNLHPIVRDEVYKIAAEALRNAFVHAHASRIEVEIRYDEEQFRLRVRDDGRGIDPTVTSSKGERGHYGLPGMRERATLIGGKLTIWSEVKQGTEVELYLPASHAYASARRGSWLSRNFSAKA